MADVSEYKWKMALTSLFQKSVQDPAFRSLCLSDPVAAIAQVSDIEVPPTIKLQFFDKREDYVHAFLLPPVSGSQTQSADPMQDMIQWATLCTDITTTFTEPP